MTIAQIITSFSSSPSRSNPANFDDEADLFLAEMELLPPQLNTFAAELNATADTINDAKNTATTQAGTATAQAGIATAQATEATTQAGTATAQAGIATAQATEATLQAGISTAQAVIAAQAATDAEYFAGIAQSFTNIDGKADKVVAATAGNLPALDATGNLVDSGSSLSDLEPAITKNTAFNKAFGTTAGTVSEGNHNHDSAYSAAGHNHDSAYSAAGHNHDSVYAKSAASNTFTKPQLTTADSSSASASVTPDLNNFSTFLYSVAGALTINNPTCSGGTRSGVRSGYIYLSSGVTSVSLGTAWKFNSGSTPPGSKAGAIFFTVYSPTFIMSDWWEAP
jgi:hypothetical protein